jgi:hypothetical protein
MEGLLECLNARLTRAGTFATEGESVAHQIIRSFGGMRRRQFDIHRIPPSLPNLSFDEMSV